MKPSGSAVPLHRRHDEIGEPSTVAIVAAADVRELLFTQDVAAMVDVERAAFFAARYGHADMWEQTTGA
jgi:hypothetical protein